MAEPYVVVSIVQGQVAEAQIRSFLESNGIPTETRGETLRTTHGIAMDGIGRVEIMVPRDRGDTARELLARVEKGEFALPENDEP